MTAAVEREAATGGRAIVRPGAVIAIVALALVALVIGINTLIENYRDRVALKGDDGKPSPIALTVRGEALTDRREVERSGPDHDPEFRVAVHLPKFAPAEGLGRSKRAAEQAAAAAMMAREGVKTERANG